MSQPCRRRRGDRTAVRNCSGFTLIELGLVILIIGVVLGMVIPRFRDRSHAELVAQTRKLAVTFRYLQHEAILNGRTYRLNYDLDRQRYWVTAATDEEGLGGFVREGGILARDVGLPEPVALSDVSLPMIAGKLHEGIAYTHFYPDGYVDQTVIHIDNGQDAYTLYVNPLTGQVYVAFGYQDFDLSS